MENAHDPLGPSTLIRRALCPGSYAAELAIWNDPIDDEDDDTRRGTARHAAAAAGLQDPIKRPLLLADLTHPEDRTLVESWWWYWDAKIGNASEHHKAGVESRLFMPGDRTGTCDAFLCWSTADGQRVLTVADLKGQPPGKARWNLQLADYVAGVMAGFKDADWSDTRIEVAIVSMAGVDEWVYGVGEHGERTERITRIIATCKADNAPRIPSSEACGYCRAAIAGTCDARRAAAATIAATAPAIVDPVAFALSLSPDQRLDLWDKLALAGKVIEAAQEKLKDAVREGRLEVPLVRVQSVSRTGWIDSSAARLSLMAEAQAKGIDADELTPLVSVSEATRLLGKATVEPLTIKLPGTPQVRRMKGAA